jgi:3-oxoacyl-[acyl-carrier protein] reductase
LVSYAIEKFGKIDVLINNAAVSRVGLFCETNPADYKKIIECNLLSVMNMSHLVVPGMVKEKSGCIINISSVWGESGASCEAVYAASKGGVNAFTKS